jgi:catechol 2,3-dioxygenase-like lactoylglutathione lyase family enzyme
MCERQEADRGEWQEKWVHIGTDEMYVCLNEATKTEVSGREAMEETGINHVGFEVADLDAIMSRMEAAGHKHSLAEEPPARRRLYVNDASEITWEFVEYLSDDPAVRNDYSI